MKCSVHFGRYIEGLNGRYITAEDVGTTEADMDLIHLETDYVTGTSAGSGSSGNPSPVTAYGIYHGMKAAAKEAFGDDSLEGKQLLYKVLETLLMHFVNICMKKVQN